MAAAGSWVPVFWVAVICNVTAAALALLWLKPRVARLVNEETTTTPVLEREVESPTEIAPAVE